MTPTKAAEDVLVDLVRKLRLLASGWGTPAVPIVLEAADAITTLLEREGDARFDDLVRGYKAGALAVHENWQEDRDPDFTEAAHDYARAALTREGG